MSKLSKKLPNLISNQTGFLSISTLLLTASLVACSSSSSDTAETAAPTTPIATTTAATPAATPAVPTPSTPAAADPADKYVGNWLSGCENNGTNSTIASATFSKISANVYGGISNAVVYTGLTCTGTVTGGGGSLTNMQMTIVGTKTTNGVLADKVMGTATEGIAKFITYSNGVTLQLGKGGTKDADGYPDYFEPYAMTKK